MDLITVFIIVFLFIVALALAWKFLTVPYQQPVLAFIVVVFVIWILTLIVPSVMHHSVP